MSKTYYWKKELLNSPITVNGARIQFEPVGPNTGVKKWEGEFNDPTISTLEQFADQRKRGISRISPEIYESLKKNHSLNPVSRPPSGFGTQLRVFDRDQSLPQSATASAAVAKPAAVANPIPVVPLPGEIAAAKKQFRPRLGRASALDKPTTQ